MLNLAAPWLIAVIASLGLVLIVVLLLIYQKKNHDLSFIKALVAKHSPDFMEDVVLPDGLDGFLFADYLLLVGNRIIVLKIMEKNGYIFGSEKIDEWTCVKNNHTEKFANPLKDVGLFAQEIKRTLDIDAVEYYVLFGKQSQFEKGMPTGVLQKVSFEEVLERPGSTTSSADPGVWEKLKVLVNESRAASAA